ncbi:phage terminase large subunit [Pseudarcicella hirudinis]
MGIPLYLYLVKNDLKFMLLIGKTETKAKKLLSGLQAQLQYNNRLKNDYGDKFQAGSWTEGDFLTTDGVRFMSLGFDQDPRGVREEGNRPDYIVCDDVDSKKSINNDRIMREAVDTVVEDIWGTFDSDDTSTERFIFANNNFHKNSITNRLHEYFEEVIRKSSKKKSTRYEILKVCAVKSLQTFQPEWPEKTSSEYWKEKFEDIPYRSFMREYMHVHVQDGAVFKHEDILFCDPLPLKKYEALCFYGDLSYKANADFKALILVGKIGREFHILHTYVRQKSRADVAKWLYDLYEDKKLYLLNIRYLIEGLFAMDEFVNDFDMEGLIRGYTIPVRADKRGKTDKYDRIEGMSGFFEKHLVFLSKKDKSPDQTVLVDQILAFEKGSNAHDDAPDALQGAISYLNKRTYKKQTKSAFGKRTSFKF